MDAKKALTMFSTPLTKCFKIIARMLADFLSFFSCQDEGIQRCNLSVIVPEENKVVSWVLYFIQFSQTSQTAAVPLYEYKKLFTTIENTE